MSWDKSEISVHLNCPERVVLLKARPHLCEMYRVGAGDFLEAFLTRLVPNFIQESRPVRGAHFVTNRLGMAIFHAWNASVTGISMRFFPLCVMIILSPPVIPMTAAGTRLCSVR